MTVRYLDITCAVISALFWAVTQIKVVILYRSFGTTYWHNIQGSVSQRIILVTHLYGENLAVSHYGKILCYINSIMVKVKVTLVQALRLCTGRMTRRGSRGIALPFHDHGTRRG